jgi:hypothetical protein
MALLADRVHGRRVHGSADPVVPRRAAARVLNATYLAPRGGTGDGVRANDARIAADLADRDRAGADRDCGDLDWPAIESELRRLGAEESAPVDLLANVMRRVGAEPARDPDARRAAGAARHRCRGVRP